MLEEQQAWDTIAAHAPRDKWLQLHEIYALVRARVELDDRDTQSHPVDLSTTWQRTVRSALKAAQQRGEVDSVPRAGIRIRRDKPSPEPNSPLGIGGE